MEDQLTGLYLWFFFLVAPIGLVLLRGMDRSLFRPQTEAHEPPLWGGAHIVAALLIWFAASILVVAFLQGLNLDVETPEVQCLVLCGVLLIVLLMVTGYLRASGQPAETVGFRKTHGTNVLILPLFFILSFLVLQPLNWGWNVVLEAVGASVEEQKLLQVFRGAVESGDHWRQLSFAVAAMVLAPLTEEIIFRGVFFGGLVHRWGFLPAAFLSSLVFGLVHLSLSASFPLFLIGVILCYLYRKSGSLYPPLIYHAIFNGTTLAVVKFVPDGAV